MSVANAQYGIDETLKAIDRININIQELLSKGNSSDTSLANMQAADRDNIYIPQLNKWREELAKALGTTKNTIPQMNDTAASPNALSLGIPGIIVIAGIIGLFILGRKN